MKDRRDRILGCLLGGALGDALGSKWEGALAPPSEGRLGLGPITDDTELTLATCQAIIKARGVDPTSIATGLVEWNRAHSYHGLGASTAKAIKELSAGFHWAIVGRTGEMAAGNGAAIRIAPVVFALGGVEEESRRLLRDICRITHHNDEAYAGALAIAVALDGIFRLGCGDPEDLLSSINRALPDCLVRDRIQMLAGLDASSQFESVTSICWISGYVADSVPLAIFAASKFWDAPIETALAKVVGLGGDTDSNAFLTGQILGCAVGRLRLDSELLRRLEQQEPILQVFHQYSEFVCT